MKKLKKFQLYDFSAQLFKYQLIQISKVQTKNRH